MRRSYLLILVVVALLAAAAAAILMLSGGTDGGAEGGREARDPSVAPAPSEALTRANTLFDFDGGAYVLPGTPTANLPVAGSAPGSVGLYSSSPSEPDALGVISSPKGSVAACERARLRERAPSSGATSVLTIRCFPLSPTATLQLATSTSAGKSARTYQVLIREKDADVQILLHPRRFDRVPLGQVAERAKELVTSLDRVDLDEYTPEQVAEAIEDTARKQP